MSSLKFLISCTAASLFALAGGAARADSSAFVTFSALEVTLFDLAPGDGIDPALTLDQVERTGSAFQYRFPDASGPAQREDRATGTGSAALADENGLATVVLRQDSMEGEAVSTGTGAYTALLADSFVFTLAPYTRAVFSALTESAVTAERIQSALAVVTLAGQAGSYPGEFASFETANVRFDSGSSAVPIAVETASAATSLSGTIALRGYAYAAGVSPVPEPGAVPMLLAGCALMAGAMLARRRRRAVGQSEGALRQPCPGAIRRLARIAGGLALAIGGAALPAAAHASSGSASIFDFSYELFDLAPADGVAPSLVFTSETINGTVNANRVTFLGNPWDESRTLSAFGSETIVKEPGSAALEITPESATVGARAWRGAFAASGNSAYGFTLTPMTRVVFSAIAEVLVAHDPNNRPDASEASAGLTGEIANFPGQRSQFSSYVSLSAPGETVRSLAVHAFSGDLAASGTITVFANAFAVGVSPIPEPAPWSMLLPGLALSAMLAPRMRSRAPQPQGVT